VDSFEYENDQLRGKGTFKKALAAYRTLLPLNVIPRIFITVNSKNLNTLTDFLDYLINQDITNIHISPLKTIGRAQEKELLPKLEELKKVVESYWWNRYGLKLKFDTNDCTNCGIGSFLTINPNGDIFPCHALSYNQFKIGNIKNKNLQDILKNSSLFNKLSNLDLHSKEGDTNNSEIPVHLQCLAASTKINELIE
jgi:MoaA/NifB/PqqE/SkfB family radical SAM enzyme